MLLWLLGILGSVEEKGRTDDGWRVEGGHAAVSPASTFAPMEKNCLWRPPKVSSLRRGAGKGPEGRLLVCSQSATIKKLFP